MGGWVGVVLCMRAGVGVGVAGVVAFAGDTEKAS